MGEARQHRLAFWLGYSGIVPFVGLALLAIVSDAETAAWAGRGLLLYAAAILSFLGGIVWGRAIAGMRDRSLIGELMISVQPSLVAWIGAWIGGTAGFWVCGIGLLAVLAYDLTVEALPGWFRRLRLHLTAWAAGSVLLVGLLPLLGVPLFG